MNTRDLKSKDIKIIRKRDCFGNFYYIASCSNIKNSIVYGHGKSPNEAIKDLYDNVDLVLGYADKLGEWGDLL